MTPHVWRNKDGHLLVDSAGRVIRCAHPPPCCQSGSGSGSGTPTVTVPCCPNPIPVTLYCTITATGCCINNAVIPIVFGALPGQWFGTVTIGGCGTMDVHFSCTGSPDVFTLVSSANCLAIGSPESCSPFSWRRACDDNGFGLCGSGHTYIFVVTETPP
jgi:hypothetical protein